ncbi:thiamine pyrophosphate protein domain protein TPP-binding [Methanococcus vannielii SB]|uniref:Indolepyruvate oxidoreductase subunit IorA n=1 Tax=Methanococcus vannielii (strain ATCC 35089 / DSM 1224 / JCM 13029 / OCM 148 / SB) TaxID=406327 RepID=A6USK8_METVS|nr:indolepyruvate ferredoxin oxidoreductase subunit alpha [Methanococcus vannielii]ABR55480.1 thiamine pyrophosphate protein domain protein TPP-binding [Methanococcus vannielii SB]
MKKLMLGNEAVARGAYEAGVLVATAYPGTPSTEVTEYIANYSDIKSQWSVNEKVALEVGIGSAIAGARTVVSMKHVGLNVAADPLMTVSYTGINAGLLIVVADDPSMHSSQNEQDTRYYGIFAKIPVLEPSNSQECKDYVKLGLEISEKYDTPVILRLGTRVSHSQSLVELKERNEVGLKSYDYNPSKYISAPINMRKRRVLVDERLLNLEKEAESISINEIEYNSKKIGIITSGVAYNYAKDVVLDASFLKLGMTYPLPTNKIAEFINSCDTVYVFEELEPITEQKIRSMGYNVIGKEVFPISGELSCEILRKVLLNEIKEVLPPFEGLPQRPPVLCPGCHHRGPFYILKKLKLHVAGDIGCYTLGGFAPLNAIDTTICMGASVGMAHGFEQARGIDFAKKSVAVIGDSTFWHSGVSGLIDIVYNKGHSTVIILDNSVTAMTGHQENPSTGKTLSGEDTPVIDFEALGKSIGIRRTRVVDAYDLMELEKVIKEETNAEEPSLIITKRPCILKKGIKFDFKTYVIDENNCNGCKLCLKIGCPAISFDGKIARINTALCVGCGLCKDVCKFSAIDIEVKQ